MLLGNLVDAVSVDPDKNQSAIAAFVSALFIFFCYGIICNHKPAVMYENTLKDTDCRFVHVTVLQICSGFELNSLSGFMTWLGHYGKFHFADALQEAPS